VTFAVPNVLNAAIHLKAIALLDVGAFAAGLALVMKIFRYSFSGYGPLVILLPG